MTRCSRLSGRTCNPTKTQLSGRSANPFYLFVLTIVWGVLVNNGSANGRVDDTETRESATTVSGGDSVSFELGFGGTAKMGVWQPFRVRVPASVIPHSFEVTVLDGKDSLVTYRGNLTGAGPQLDQYQGWVKLGRMSGSVKLKLLDIHQREVFQQSFRLKQTGRSIVPSTTRLVLTLEPKRELADSMAAVSTQIGSMASNDRFVPLNDPGSLPNDWFCYQGVETIYVMTSREELIEQVSAAQWAAIDEWVVNGGRLVLSVAEHGDTLLGNDQPLRALLPGAFAGRADLADSGNLESFAEGGPLIRRGDSPIAFSRLANVAGTVVLQEGDDPLIVRAAHGFGEVMFVAFDLDSPRIRQWAGYSGLIRRLEGRSNSRDFSESKSTGNLGHSVSHFGYDDLIGQLRVPLDKFSQVGFVAFTWIAMLIALYILYIGPGDYFLLSRLLRKMELTWLTFPLASLMFCGLAWWIADQTRPGDIQLNQMEIIDVDAVSKRVRGTVWTHLYSPLSQTCDIEVADESGELGFDLESVFLSWHGLPGDGLGGMMTQNALPFQQEPYRQSIESKSDERNPQTASEPASSLPEFRKYWSGLERVPIQVSSTRQFFTHWNSALQESVSSDLILSNRSGRLEGSVSNPLNVPLTNVRIFFDSYVYLYKNSRLTPGNSIDIVADTSERTINSMLTRRTKSEGDDGRSQNRPWDPADISIPRIADMLMFYQAAGGKNYTGLTHNYQDRVDFSNLIQRHRAVLVGKIDGLGTEFAIDGESVSEQYDQVYTVVRIVLPVEVEK